MLNLLKCPKCSSLLLIDRYNKREEKEYYCIGCSCYGTIQDMEMQKTRSDIIFKETRYKKKIRKKVNNE